jgi:uncharacterized protein (TIGR02996 family)
MTEGDALYRAILADPDDDTPRLAYADWLCENGEDDRAEFIRVQCELARNPTLALRAKEKALWALHGEQWLAPLKAQGQPLYGGAHGEFRRGFVEVVWMPASDFRARAEELFDRLPVRELRVVRCDATEFGKLVTYPLLGRLTGLDLSDRRLGDVAPRGLAWSPFVDRLQLLRLRGCGITDVGAELLAVADADWRLAELDVSHNPISPAALAALRERYGDAVRAERAPAN